MSLSWEKINLSSPKGRQDAKKKTSAQALVKEAKSSGRDDGRGEPEYAVNQMSLIKDAQADSTINFDCRSRRPLNDL